MKLGGEEGKNDRHHESKKIIPKILYYNKDSSAFIKHEGNILTVTDINMENFKIHILCYVL